MNGETQTDSVCLLLLEIKDLIQNIECLRKRNGSEFNIFSVLGVGYKETIVCKFLREILSPIGTHGAGPVYLKTFLEDVLGQKNISFEELMTATVNTEERINNDRRIDLFIRVGKKVFPIEAKIYARDQEEQCSDYYKYCRDKYNQETIMYYLTLDKHEPDSSSKGQLAEGENIKLISFEDEVLNWLDKIIELKETKERPVVEEILDQFRNTILQLTEKNTKEINMKLNEVINSSEDFKAAEAIANGIGCVKANMMKKCFSTIEEYFKDKGIHSIYADYKEKSESFYSKREYPSLNYKLPDDSVGANNQFVLRVEVDHNFFFGISNWDGKTNPKGTDDFRINEVIKEKSGEMWENNRTEYFYFWKYLFNGNSTINFKTCNEGFCDLFDAGKFKQTMDTCCEQIEELLSIWGVPIKKTNV